VLLPHQHPLRSYGAEQEAQAGPHPLEQEGARVPSLDIFCGARGDNFCFAAVLSPGPLGDKSVRRSRKALGVRLPRWWLGTAFRRRVGAPKEVPVEHEADDSGATEDVLRFRRQGRDWRRVGRGSSLGLLGRRRDLVVVPDAGQETADHSLGAVAGHDRAVQVVANGHSVDVEAGAGGPGPVRSELADEGSEERRRRLHAQVVAENLDHGSVRVPEEISAQAPLEPADRGAGELDALEPEEERRLRVRVEAQEKAHVRFDGFFAQGKTLPQGPLVHARARGEGDVRLPLVQGNDVVRRRGIGDVIRGSRRKRRGFGERAPHLLGKGGEGPLLHELDALGARGALAEEFPPAPIGVGFPQVVKAGGVGDAGLISRETVEPSAWGLVLLQDDHVLAVFGQRGCRRQPRGPGAYHHHLDRVRLGVNPALERLGGGETVPGRRVELGRENLIPGVLGPLQELRSFSPVVPEEECCKKSVAEQVQQHHNSLAVRGERRH